jgi:hypothetical protein
LQIGKDKRVELQIPPNPTVNRKTTPRGVFYNIGESMLKWNAFLYYMIKQNVSQSNKKHRNMNENYFDHLENSREMSSDELRFFEERMRFRNYRLNRNRKKIALSIILIGVITFIILNAFTEVSNFTATLIGLITTSLGIGLFLLNYLQTDIFINGERIPNFNSRILFELDDLKLELQKIKKKSGGVEDNQQVEKTISSIINRILSKEFIQSKIEKTLSDNAIKNFRSDNLFSEFEKTSFRINEELNRLRKSANINLVIGSLSTSIAIFALTYEVFFSEVDFSNNVDILSHYIPRISLVIFIEIFAFFFLKLYKSNLLEIKYFNNEKTNIDFKLITLKTALFQDDMEMIKLCLSELIKTERNFVLKKDETTVEIEKIKTEKHDNQIMASLFEKLLSKK